ncbi:hypothetical protein KQI38_13485 [Tissierella carlieri]|jgi:cell fate (sporulation/competence/biofilm development) regulator YlbF (YheA/YmcA/DUF963 family)|uniref:Uncharacterized protein n=1 Tax=Tissierella carlieri TaxID=689904 RepID=A0ABT1S9C2_9FIRM|nr:MULTISPECIES: hypothetical protein [Tissierella]MBU5313050.1 hypothetical protein [Tissierella carlieri]MCQ4923064.1 hypothetical protein [Tissierella carlieri]MDU5081881.1 hypothetical protein [Bacillota bacterium]
MEDKNKLSQVTLANIDNEELKEIQNLEQKLDDKYYILAFKKTENETFS